MSGPTLDIQIHVICGRTWALACFKDFPGDKSKQEKRTIEIILGEQFNYYQLTMYRIAHFEYSYYYLTNIIIILSFLLHDQTIQTGGNYGKKYYYLTDK